MSFLFHVSGFSGRAAPSLLIAGLMMISGGCGERPNQPGQKIRAYTIVSTLSETSNDTGDGFYHTVQLLVQDEAGRQYRCTVTMDKDHLFGGDRRRQITVTKILDPALDNRISEADLLTESPR